VNANQEAAGVDGQSITELEANLSGNLYKFWNRLSSGSYFPPPVRRVDIPKAGGGTRPLGIPCSLGPAVLLTARLTERPFHLVLEFHEWKGLGTDSEEKHERVSDIHTAAAG